MTNEPTETRSIVKVGDLIFIPSGHSLRIHRVTETVGSTVVSSREIVLNEDVLVFENGEHQPDFEHPREVRRLANAAKRKAKAAAKLEAEKVANAPIKATKKQATNLAELARKSRERMQETPQ